jgi:hypothetical protein
VLPDKSVLAACGSAVVHVSDDRLETAAGGFDGNVHLLAGPDGEPWALTGHGVSFPHGDGSADLARHEGRGPAWAWLTATRLTRAAEAAALRGQAAVARELRRKVAGPGHSRRESFTATRRHVIRSMATSQVTVSSSLHALAAEGNSASDRGYRRVSSYDPGSRTINCVQPQW